MNERKLTYIYQVIPNVIFFENKTSHFYVDLERPLILKNGSTCAVEEVIYSNRFYNIIPPYNKIIVKKNKSD